MERENEMIVISQPLFIELGLHGGRMDVRKEVSPVQRLYRETLGRSPDFPPSDLSHTMFLPSQGTECS